MKVTMYSPDGKTMETIDAENVVPICSSSGFMGVVLEGPDDTEKIFGLGVPKRYFNTNLPLVIEGSADVNAWREPEPTEQSFVVKLISDSGVVIRTWGGAQGPYFLGKIFGFRADGEWVQVTGNVIYEPE